MNAITAKVNADYTCFIAGNLSNDHIVHIALIPPDILNEEPAGLRNILQ